jgi:hypothetical protein
VTNFNYVRIRKANFKRSKTFIRSIEYGLKEISNNVLRIAILNVNLIPKTHDKIGDYCFACCYDMDVTFERVPN